MVRKKENYKDKMMEILKNYDNRHIYFIKMSSTGMTYFNILLDARHSVTVIRGLILPTKFKY